MLLPLACPADLEEARVSSAVTTTNSSTVLPEHIKVTKSLFRDLLAAQTVIHTDAGIPVVQKRDAHVLHEHSDSCSEQGCSNC